MSASEKNLTSNLRLENQRELRLEDTTNSNYTALKAPLTLASNLTLTMPSAAPTVNNQALVSTTGGTMSWASVIAGGGGKAVLLHHTESTVTPFPCGVFGFTNNGSSANMMIGGSPGNFANQVNWGETGLGITIQNLSTIDMLVVMIPT